MIPCAGVGEAAGAGVDVGARVEAGADSDRPASPSQPIAKIPTSAKKHEAATSRITVSRLKQRVRTCAVPSFALAKAPVCEKPSSALSTVGKVANSPSRHA